ncbi:MAG: hypothetical protein HY827_04695 [Actinobacteria bacterium]|nr:hypothetical protein [Actinomycetota bacterium]
MPASTPAAANFNDKLLEAAENARSNPYIQKLIEDEQLRDNAITALKSARKAFDRASKKGWDKELAKDKKLRREVEDALSGIRETKAGLADVPKKSKASKASKAKHQTKRKRRPLRKLIFLAIIGGTIAMLASEDVRKQVLDALFGAEEEFQYSSTTGTSANGSS